MSEYMVEVAPYGTSTMAVPPQVVARGDLVAMSTLFPVVCQANPLGARITLYGPSWEVLAEYSPRGLTEYSPRGLLS